MHPFRWLLNRGVKYPQIKKLMEDGFDAWTDSNNAVADADDSHADETTWFLADCNRTDAERLLNGKPTGTFLIRPSASGDYALSIACNGITNHCLIYKTPHGFGFAIPYNVYETLQNLVLHYAQSSLEEHNDQLPTTLKHPVLSPYIKQQAVLAQQQQQPQPQQPSTTSTSSTTQPAAASATGAKSEN